VTTATPAAADPEAFARRWLPDAVYLARHLLRRDPAAQRDDAIAEGIALDALCEAALSWRPDGGANPFTFLRYKLRGRISNWRKAEGRKMRGGGTVATFSLDAIEGFDLPAPADEPDDPDRLDLARCVRTALDAGQPDFAEALWRRLKGSA